jgi:hypothetical protein
LKSSSIVLAGEKVLDSIARPAIAIFGFFKDILQLKKTDNKIK